MRSITVEELCKLKFKISQTGKVTCTFYSNFELGIYEDNFKIPFLEYPDIFSMLEWLGTNMSKMPARCQLLVS